MEWRCNCGEPFADSGDGSGLGRARKHVLEEGQVEKGVHRILGLWVNGEQVMSGQSRRQAEHLGYITPKDAQQDQGSGIGKASASGVAAVGGAKRGSNIAGFVPFRKINLSPAIEGYFALHRARFANNWSPDDAGIAQWIFDIVEGFTRHHFDYIFQIDPGDPQIEAKRGQALRVLETIRAMDDPEGYRRQEAVTVTATATQPAVATQQTKVLDAFQEQFTRITSLLQDLAGRIARLEGALDIG